MHVVFIHGPPASGKFTIARELARLTGLKLFHNHLAVDLAASLFEFGSPPFCSLREHVWLEAFRRAAAHEVSFIFTFHPEASVDPEFIERARKLIEGGKGRIHFVEIQCPEAVLEERLSDPGRKRFGKLTDLDLYRRLRAEGAFRFPLLPTALVQISSHEMQAGEAAGRIAAALDAQPG